MTTAAGASSESSVNVEQTGVSKAVDFLAKFFDTDFAKQTTANFLGAAVLGLIVLGSNAYVDAHTKAYVEASEKATKEHVEATKKLVEASEKATKEHVDASEKATKEHVEATKKLVEASEKATKEHVDASEKATKEHVEAIEKSTKDSLDLTRWAALGTAGAGILVAGVAVVIAAVRK
jgi:flagellar basal body P-ring protein FlgI